MQNGSGICGLLGNKKNMNPILIRLQEALDNILKSSKSGLTYELINAQPTRINSVVPVYRVTGHGIGLTLSIEINEHVTSCTLFIHAGWMQTYLLYGTGLRFKYALQLDLIRAFYRLNMIIRNNPI